jgi:diaminopimelate decarboxylase
VLYRKANGPKQFVIVDAGMNDLIHPATTNTSTRRHVIPNNARDRPIQEAIIFPLTFKGFTEVK